MHRPRARMVLSARRPSAIVMAFLIAGCSTADPHFAEAPPADDGEAAAPPSYIDEGEPTAATSYVDGPPEADPVTATGCFAAVMRWSWNADDAAPDVVPTSGEARLEPVQSFVWAHGRIEVEADDGATLAVTLTDLSFDNATPVPFAFPADGADFEVPGGLAAGPYEVVWTATGRLAWGLQATGFTCKSAPAGASQFDFEKPAVLCGGRPLVTRVLDWRADLTAAEQGTTDFLVPEQPLGGATLPRRAMAAGAWSWTILDAAGAERASEVAAEVEYRSVSAQPNPLGAANIRWLSLEPGPHRFEWTFAGVSEDFRVPIDIVHCDDVAIVT